MEIGLVIKINIFLNKINQKSDILHMIILIIIPILRKDIFVNLDTSYKVLIEKTFFYIKKMFSIKF